MNSSHTYDKILEVARRLFVQQGYTATSMRQIAEEAGVGKATIYHHFPDKKSMVMELFKKATASMDDYTRLVRAEQDPRKRLQVATESSMRFHSESLDIIQIIRREVPEGRKQMMAGYSDFYKEYTALLSDAIQSGVAQGVFRSVDPNEAARVLMTMIQGVLASAFLINEREASPEKTTAALLDVFFRGIDAR